MTRRFAKEKNKTKVGIEFLYFNVETKIGWDGFTLTLKSHLKKDFWAYVRQSKKLPKNAVVLCEKK